MGRGYYSDAFRLQLKPPKENAGTALGEMFMQLGALADKNYQDMLKEEQIRTRQDLLARQIDSDVAWKNAQMEHQARADELAQKQAEEQGAIHELKMLEAGNLMADRGALTELPNYNTFEEFSKHFTLNNPESLTIAKTYYDDRRKVADEQTVNAIRAALYKITGGVDPTPEQQNYFNTSETGRELWAKYPAAMVAVNDTINGMRRERSTKKEEKNPLEKTLYKTLDQLPVDARGKGAAIIGDPSLTIEQKLSKLGELGVKAELSVDKRKATQKFAEAVGTLKGAVPLLGRLVEDYNTGYTGFLDTPIHAAAEYIGTADPKLTAYKQDLKKLFILQKKIDNMGANFTKSEQEMLRSTMPNDMKSDEAYAPQLLNYIRTMRDIVKGKIESVRGTNYDTGDLENVVAELDGVLERAKQNPALKHYAEKILSSAKEDDGEKSSKEDAWSSARGASGSHDKNTPEQKPADTSGVQNKLDTLPDGSVVRIGGVPHIKYNGTWMPAVEKDGKWMPAQ